MPPKIQKKIHWADKIAERIISEFPNEREYTLAAGITPSGPVHVGNLREVMTTYFVYRALKDKGVRAKFILFWDDYDRLRKVPQNIPNRELLKDYIGKPISEIPDPFGTHTSYAEHFEREFEDALKELNIKPDLIVRQSEMYKKGKYLPHIKKILKKADKINEILSKYKVTQQKEKIFPIRVYCRKCGTDFTRVVSYDTKRDMIHYKCEKCGNEEKIPISGVPHKLVWRVDWPFRWSYYNIHFEPGGKDHASPGGSYDTGKEIIKEVFNRKPPVFQGYEFVGLKGIAGKMSSSTGILITPNELLNIYEPEIVKYIFAKHDPMHGINIDLGKDVLKVYAEFDREVEEHLNGNRKRYLELVNGKLYHYPFSFKQIAMLGQIFGWELDKIKRALNKLNIKIDEKFLQKRIEKAKYWVENYYPQFKMKLREGPNFEYARNLTDEEREWLEKLKEALESESQLEKKIHKGFSVEELEKILYDIPKKPGLSNREIKKRQRRFFQILYNLLIDSDEGPRAATLIYLLGKEKVDKLLNPILKKAVLSR